MTAVSLMPMTAGDFRAWFDVTAAGYAADKVRAGNWPAEGALERSVAELHQLLPQGEASNGHLLFAVCDAVSGLRVGSLWLFYGPTRAAPDAYVYNIVIDAAQRGKGYGAQALLAGEAAVKERGAKRMGLHVFGFNISAQRLYQKLGYQITNINMAKAL